jgi:hypothetical protein
MPMDFPDMRSLEMAAEMWKFRQQREGESELQYLIALADFDIVVLNSSLEGD